MRVKYYKNLSSNFESLDPVTRYTLSLIVAIHLHMIPSIEPWLELSQYKHHDLELWQL